MQCFCIIDSYCEWWHTDHSKMADTLSCLEHSNVASTYTSPPPPTECLSILAELPCVPSVHFFILFCLQFCSLPLFCPIFHFLSFLFLILDIIMLLFCLNQQIFWSFKHLCWVSLKGKTLACQKWIVAVEEDANIAILLWSFTVWYSLQSWYYRDVSHSMRQKQLNF